MEKNFQTYKEQASKILDLSKIEVRYNHEWLEKLKFQEIMGLASHFTVQQMLQRDMFKERMSWKVICVNCNERFNSPIQFKSTEDLKGAKLEGNTVKCPHCGKMTPCNKENLLPPPSPVTPNEFLYPLMQGYDSVHMEVDLEVGGNDQLFNMLAGRTLLKAYKNKEKFVLTTPLIEGTDGRKMSKSYNNTIDITDPPSDMFGKVMSMADEMIIKYFQLCTDVPLKEINEIEADMKSGGNPRDAKVRLAREIVTLYHSADAGRHAEDEFINVFKKGGLPDDIPEFNLSGDHNIIDLLEACNLIDSRADAKRLIKQGGVKVSDKKVDDTNAMIHLEKDMVIQVGKRRFAKII